MNQTDPVALIVLDHDDPPRCRSAAQLHQKNLSYRSFITIFGVDFLAQIYRDLLSQRLGVMVMMEQGGQLRGFVLGCVDTERLFKMVARRIGHYGGHILRALVKNPRLIFKLLETLFYSRKEDCAVAAELIVIVVEEGYRSKGLGGRLTAALEHAFRHKGIARYKVTVHAAMARSNRFYAQNGFRRHRQFKMYGVLWNLYIKQIGLA